MNKILIKKSIKNNTGAVSVLVLITLLTFVMVLSGVFFITTSLYKSQLQSNAKIQKIYDSDVNNIDDIYDSLLLNSNSI